jgi:septum formation protein
VLASASPRRRELLRYLGIPYESVATDAEEEQTEPPRDVVDALPAFSLNPRQHPTLLAWRKANELVQHGYRALILGADTIVVIDGQILNKPTDPGDARRMLRQLAGRTHTVYTGLVLIDAVEPGSRVFDLVQSGVTMAELSDDEIAAYVASGEPLDKAGAYGIQGLGGRLVQRVEGSYTSVVGLPFPAVYQALKIMGIQDIVEPQDAFRQWLADQGKDVPPCTAP